MIERELTTPVSLTGADGLLNPDAVGWARRPLVDTAGIPGRRARGRNKRWEYWNVLTPTHLIALTISDIDYAAVHEVWVYERATGREVHRGAIGALGGSASLPATLGAGPARARSGDLAIAVDEVDGGTRLRARIPGASFDVTAARPAGHECLAVVVPWSATRFQYTVKDLARPALGWVRIGDERFEVPPGSWAALDHGRGRWPYDVAWNWGGGAGIWTGRTFGLQVGGRWTDGTGSTENSILVDDTLHKISAELDWSYDLADWRAPWQVRGGGLEATFTPFHLKSSRTNLLVLTGRTDQAFGHWSGRYDTGTEVVEFADLIGWAEDVHNRW